MTLAQGGRKVISPCFAQKGRLLEMQWADMDSDQSEKVAHQPILCKTITHADLNPNPRNTKHAPRLSLVSHADVRSVSNQSPDCSHAAVLGCIVKRGIALVVSNLEACSSRHQSVNHRDVVWRKSGFEVRDAGDFVSGPAQTFGAWMKKEDIGMMPMQPLHGYCYRGKDHKSKAGLREGCHS
jgi:hypothetical protein